MDFDFVVDFNSVFNPLFNLVFDPLLFLRGWSCGHVLVAIFCTFGIPPILKSIQSIEPRLVRRDFPGSVSLCSLHLGFQKC